MPAPLPPGLARIGCWVVAGALLVRGAGGFLLGRMWPETREGPFARANAMVYSPLCVLLGALAAIVAAS